MNLHPRGLPLIVLLFGCRLPPVTADDGGALAGLDAMRAGMGADSGTDSGTDSGIHMGPACPSPEALAVAQVEVHVHNPNVSDRLVATEEDWGGRCDPIALIDAGRRKLALVFGQQTVCEGPPPVVPHSTTWRRVKSGDSLQLSTWDGRELVLCTKTVPCDPPWKGAPPQDVVMGSLHPVAAGSYEVTVAEELYPPMGCQSDDGVLYRCDASQSNQAPGVIDELCPSSMTASAGFALPARGVSTVTVELK